MNNLIVLKGAKLPDASYRKGIERNIHSASQWQIELLDFLSDWLSGNNSITVQTSGSTGEPKLLAVSKQAMIESAKRTLDFFKLTPYQVVLSCLPVTSIAGKMMVVRALVGKLDLVAVEPSGFPLQHVSSIIDFAAFTPMQMLNELEQHSNSKLHLLREVIIGGGVVSLELDTLLRDQQFRAHETYGMTETLSHVASRKINGNDKHDYFSALPGVIITTDKRGCLVVDAPYIPNAPVVTNDFGEMRPDGSFRVTGRVDNVINSGGVKIQPEKIEEVISNFCPGPLHVSAIPHPALGEQLVLVTVGLPADLPGLFRMIKEMLPSYQRPDRLFTVSGFPVTVSGKINRKLLRDQIMGLKPVYSKE